MEDRELEKLWKGHRTVCRPEEDVVKPRVRLVGGRPWFGSSEMLRVKLCEYIHTLVLHLGHVCLPLKVHDRARLLPNPWPELACRWGSGTLHLVLL